MKQLEAITGTLVQNLANDTNTKLNPSEGGQEFVSEAKKLTDSLAPEVKRMFNGYIEQLMALKPTIKRQLNTDSEIKAYKQQFVLALSQARIDSPDKLEFGLTYARLDSKHPFVDIGLFVSWCKEGYQQHIRQQELLGNVQKITDEKLMLSNRTFEERQAEARENIQGLKNILKKCK